MGPAKATKFDDPNTFQKTHSQMRPVAIPTLAW
ncbi:hypothetical protein MEA186_28537, partial [Mesorhizobium amorphae CCNWGS0123]